MPRPQMLQNMVWADFYVTSRQEFRSSFRELQDRSHDANPTFTTVTLFTAFHLWKYGTWPRTSWFTTFFGTRAWARSRQVLKTLAAMVLMHSSVRQMWCGVTTTLSSLSSGLSAGVGSCSNTSRPAPAIRRLESASSRAL